MCVWDGGAEHVCTCQRNRKHAMQGGDQKGVRWVPRDGFRMNLNRDVPSSLLSREQPGPQQLRVLRKCLCSDRLWTSAIAARGCTTRHAVGDTGEVTCQSSPSQALLPIPLNYNSPLCACVPLMRAVHDVDHHHRQHDSGPGKGAAVQQADGAHNLEHRPHQGKARPGRAWSLGGSERERE